MVSNTIITTFLDPSWPLGTAFINVCHGCSSVTDDLLQSGICLNYKKLQKYGSKIAFCRYPVVLGYGNGT